MKFLINVSLLAVIAAASPTPIVRRQFVDNELVDGPCKSVTFIMARGSTEVGNMGETVGPAVCAKLKASLNNNVACQGVGGAYLATLTANFLPDGTTDAAIDEADKMFALANSKCPQSQVVFGGYSQGSAVMLGSVSKLPQSSMSQIAGGVFFGYTKNKQTNSMIPNFPPEKLKIFCRPDDGVCGGALLVTAGHLAYVADGSVGQASDFLVGKVDLGGKIDAAPM